MVALDPGTVVNPLTAEMQTESAVVFGLTAALYGARLATKPAIFGEKEPRSGELTWRAYRKAVTVGEATATKLADVDITPAS